MSYSAFMVSMVTEDKTQILTITAKLLGAVLETVAGLLLCGFQPQ